MSTAVAEKHPQKVINLCRALKKGPVPFKKLSEELREPEVVSYAFATGLIQVGRQMYSLVLAGTPEVVKKDNKPVLDENKRPIMERKYIAKPDNEWSWVGTDSRCCKPVAEIMEEELPDGVELHAKLTSAGMAATL
jgi:hypothetical protein